VAAVIIAVCWESLGLYVYSTQPNSQFLSVQASMLSTWWHWASHKPSALPVGL